MSESKKRRLPSGNLLLAALPLAESNSLSPHLEVVQLSRGETLYMPDSPIRYVYFPITALLSRLATTKEGDMVEVGITGYEGMVGISVILGSNTTPYYINVQHPGAAFKMKARVFKEVFARSATLQTRVLAYIHTWIAQLSQCAACNRFHTVEQRLSRWLLAAHDRADSDTLLLTQEVIAGMIGAGRPSVSLALGILQSDGLIRARRGTLTIINRKGLEATACECYRTLREEFDRFLRG